MYQEHVHVEAPITPDGQVQTSEGNLDVVAFARLPEDRRTALISDPYVRAAALHAGTTGVTAWPGALRWLALSREGRPVPAIVHNTYILSRLYGMDVVADPDQPMYYIDEDGERKSIIGWASQNWRSGDIRVASGVPQMLPIAFTDRMRKLAWAEFLSDIESLRPGEANVVQPTTGQVAFPSGQPVVADMIVVGDLAYSTLVLGDRESLDSIDISIPVARDIASNPTAEWAWCVAEGLMARVANACGTMPDRLPPRGLSTLTSPEEVLLDLSRRATRAKWILVGGSALAVGGVMLLNWISKSKAPVAPVEGTVA